MGLWSTSPELTERERAVARLVAGGHSSKDIGRLLRISPKTVDCHRQSILRKIGGRGLAAIVRYAIRTKLVDL